MQEIIEIADCSLLQYSSELGQCKIQNFDLININKKVQSFRGERVGESKSGQRLSNSEAATIKI